ncbi:uncharacterized protein [Haliotis asinina]|uniref:uncharacterized protein isoform X2 n=1 Tax=Haliotis asinina TaxID=109174 RepID=UPI003531F334
MARATWSLSVKNSTLYFSHSNNPEPCAVSNVKPSGQPTAVTIQLHDDVDIECPIHKYAVTDNLWSDLSKREDSDDFLETLDMLMGVYKVTYQGADLIQNQALDASPAETSPTDVEPLNFKATVMAFRNLHPRSGKSETAPLGGADMKWRKQCQATLKPTDPSLHHFGGRFKVHLAVAATSDRCYRLILEIIDLFSLGKLKEQKHTKVNTCLFLETVSFKDEATLYRKLTEFRNSEISKEEFNLQLKQIKQANKGAAISQDTAIDVLVLKEQLKEKDRLIEELRTQNLFLRQELDKMVYAFNDSDDDHDFQITLVQDLLHEESARERLENVPGVESSELPVIPYKGRASRNGRKNLQTSLKKKAPEKASRIAETEEMAESYLQKRRHNKEMAPCKFKVGLTVEALENDGFWYKAKVLSVQRERVKIHWTGYDMDEWLPTRNVRFELKSGDKVEAPWLVHRAARYPGHVEHVDGEYVRIEFNDKTKKRIHFKYIDKITP